MDPGQTFGQTNYDAPVRIAQDERVESEAMTCTDTDAMTHARSGQHARGALITRRSRVQIPPLPLKKAQVIDLGLRPVGERVTGVVYRVVATQASDVLVPCLPYRVLVGMAIASISMSNSRSAST